MQEVIVIAQLNHHLRLLDLLLASVPDCHQFCRENGVEQLGQVILFASCVPLNLTNEMQFIENRQEDELAAETMHYIIATSLDLLYRATNWMLDANLPEELKTLKFNTLQA